MKKILNAIDKVSTWTAIAIFVVMALIMTVNIVARMFSGGLSWYMESAQFLNVWSVFIAGVGLCAANDHLRIDAIDGLLRKRGGALKVAHLIVSLVTTLFFIMLGVAFFLLAGKSRQTIATIPMFKMALVYWPIPVLCLLSAAATLMRGIYDYRTFGQEEEPKEETVVC